MNMGHSTSAVIVAAVSTSSGDGMVRDLLAGRKTLVLRSEIYAFGAILAGILIALEIIKQPIELFLLFIGIVVLIVLSYTLEFASSNSKALFQ